MVVEGGGVGGGAAMKGADFGKSKQFGQKTLVGFLHGDMSGFPSVRIILNFLLCHLDKTRPVSKKAAVVSGRANNSS